MEREGSLHTHKHTDNASSQANFSTLFTKTKYTLFGTHLVEIMGNTVARSKMGLMSILSTVQWAESV